MISGFRSEVDENRALLDYYAANSVSMLPTFRDNLLGASFRGQESKRKAGGNPSTQFILGRVWAGVRSQQRGGSWHHAAENVHKELPLLSA